MQSGRRVKNNATSESLRSYNRATILRLLFEKGSIPRSQLAKITGLTQPSVSRIVSECIEAGLIQEEDSVADSKESATESSKVGKKPIPLTLSRDHYFVGAIHIGTFWIYLGVMNLRGQLLDYVRLDRPKVSAEGIIQLIITEFQTLTQQYSGTILTIGLVMNARVDRESGVIIGHNIQGWENIPISSILEKELNIPVFLENNIFALTIAESFQHPLPPDKPLLLINIGSTIGMGLVINNRMVRGSQGLAGTLEHMPWHTSGPECECGNNGCLSSLLADRSLLRQASTFIPQLPNLTMENLIELSKTDERILALLKNRAEILGHLLANLTSMYDPERLILTGIHEDQYEWVKKSYEKWRIPSNRPWDEIFVPKNYRKNSFVLDGPGIIALQAVYSTELQIKPSRAGRMIAMFPLDRRALVSSLNFPEE